MEKQNKKIGILTFWYGNSNYGQILQCFALQHFLRRQGYDAYLIRFIGYGESRFRKFVKACLPFLCAKPDKFDRMRHFEAFRKEHLQMSPLYTSLAQIQQNPPKAEAYIAGSDQIWMQSLDNPQQRAYFLDFGDERTKRIAYAASFGIESYPESHRELLGQQLQRFNAISCRERSGIDICKQVGAEATRVLDPTLLLTREDYLNLNPNLNPDENSSLFIYSLNISSAEDIRWNELRETIDGKVVVTPAAGYNESAELFGSDVEYLYATPWQWVTQIASAGLVVTTSFHGIAFSILMHTPFVYVPLKGTFAKANNRILDLLRDLHLEDRTLSEQTTYGEIIARPIDWKTVDDVLNEKRKESIEFLEKALGVPLHT
ncbi:MAG: polysaccharide pyruvyl transferase family protein [Bacteroidaceae bacterium]|nr:polysaccharide pyruvyl transferase family protein [Bacteroidaceae bacterium]